MHEWINEYVDIRKWINKYKWMNVYYDLDNYNI